MGPAEAKLRFLFVDASVADFLKDRLSIARRVQEAGVEVHVALPREHGLDAVSNQGLQVHVFYLRRKSTRPLDELRSFASLLRLYQSIHPTLVHHTGMKPALYGGIAARIVGVPAIVSTLTGLGHLFTTCSARMRFLRAVVTRALRFGFAHENHCVVFQHSSDRDRLLASCNLPGNRAIVIRGSGVNLSSFASSVEPDGLPVVLLASRLLWEKGVAEFVAASRALRARGICARFVLAGEPDHGHPSSIPIGTLERWRHAGDIEWTGVCNEMPALIAQSHIVCLPTSYGEGIPRILLEAAASGRPIVATDSPGCREVVRHGQNGLLVPLGDGAALAGAIALLIANAPLRMAMGARGREIAVSEFSVAQVIDATLAVYRSVLLAIPVPLNALVPGRP